MKKLLTLSIALILSCSVNYLKAQSKIKEGKLTMSLNYSSPELDTIPEELKSLMETLLPKQNTIYFKQGSYRIESESGNMKRIIIHDNKTRESILCLDMMGEKIAMKISNEEINKMKSKMKDEKPVILPGDETKMIAGIKCKKVTVSNKGNIPAFDAWWTDELAITNSADPKIEGVGGFLMDFKIIDKRFTVSETCIAFEKISVPDSFFKIPVGYQIRGWENNKSARITKNL